jgi:hypothetical protein
MGMGEYVQSAGIVGLLGFGTCDTHISYPEIEKAETTSETYKLF